MTQPKIFCHFRDTTPFPIQKHGCATVGALVQNLYRNSCVLMWYFEVAALM
ncbi:MAG: hypothetical protein JST70_00195 [Bacteroidetes bacterium]|nr:hypothetical protein [Bacteroidota bacterium]